MTARNNLGFGCVSLTQHRFLKAAQSVLALAFEQGINHFDTSPVYGNGYSEKILGGFIKNRRSQVTITTKCGLGNIDQPSINVNVALFLNGIKNRMRKQEINPEIKQPIPLEIRSIGVAYVEASLNKSLKNLRTDYIDYYFLHETLPAFLTEEATLFLKKQQEKGIIGQLGVAASYINIAHLEPSDLEGFAVLQYENGPHYKTDYFLNKFNDKRHFYHSTLKSIRFLGKWFSAADWAGILINRACMINPSGKILFSTSNKTHLRTDLDSVVKYSTYSLDDLNKLIHATY